MHDFRFDIIRAIAILFVVSIHSCALLFESAVANTSWGIDKIFYTLLQLIFIAVPVFVMLSGSLLLGKVEPLSIFFKKRLTRVVIPFCFWSIIVYAISYYQEGGRSMMGYFMGLADKTFFGQGAHSIYWFVYAIIGLYLFTPFLRYLYAKINKTEAYYLLSLLLLIFVANKLLPLFNMTKLLYSPNLEYLMYFVAGYTIVKYVQYESWFPKLTIFSFIVGWLLLAFRFLYTKSFDDQLAIYRVMAALSFFSLFFLKKRVANEESESKGARKVIMKVVRLLSSYSYGIYLTHFMFISLFLRFHFMHTIPVCLEYFLMVVAVIVADVLMLFVLKRLKLEKWTM